MTTREIKAWAIVAVMKDGSTELNAIEGPQIGEDFPTEFCNIFPVYDNKESAEDVASSTPVLSLKVVPCTITYTT